MRISIGNFKSIGSLAHYRMRPLTILSGTNSSGKSSFIQLLLLLKQTFEIDSAQHQLYLEGNLIRVGSYLDIIKDKDINNKLIVELAFNNTELAKYNQFADFSVYNSLGDFDLFVRVEFDQIERKKIIVSKFEVRFVSELEAQSSITRFENINNSKYSIHANRPVTVSNDLLGNSDFIIRKISYSSFIPSEIEIEKFGPAIDLPDGSTSLPTSIVLREVPKLEGVKQVLSDFFGGISYVGPFRQPPKDEYSNNGRVSSVGIDGENMAEVLSELSHTVVSYFRVVEGENFVSFIRSQDFFINVVKYWLCERLKLCADVVVKKEVDTYIIEVTSLSGVISTIKHVGFGISQVLPIIVEGLRLKESETLILEQPEVHLHPKAQSDLCDFLISLVSSGKKVIVETHSDHLITRIRRRIAEDRSSELDDKVLLTFVEVGEKDVLFRNIDIDDFGVLEFPFPDDFTERTDIELRAILKAQMYKRLNQGGQ
jgi:predicted ATPase